MTSDFIVFVQWKTTEQLKESNKNGCLSHFQVHARRKLCRQTSKNDLAWAIFRPGPSSHETEDP